MPTPQKSQPKLSAAFGEVVRCRRIAAGLTQDGLAKKARVTRNYVGMLERGERGPTLAVLQLLANAFGVRMSALVLELEEMIPQRY